MKNRHKDKQNSDRFLPITYHLLPKIVLLISYLLFLTFLSADDIAPLTTITEQAIPSNTLKTYDIATYLQTAVAEYQANNFEKALDNFLLVENAGVTNPDLYYNIGNAYYRLSNIPLAIVYYKRALLLDSSHRPAQRNLSFVLELTPDQQTFTDENLLASFVVKAIHFFSINTLLVICLTILTIIVIIIHIQWYYTQIDRTVLRFVNFVLLFIWVIFVGLTITRINLLNSSEAVITDNTVYVYSGPSENFTRLFTIHTGTVLKIQREEGDWTQITTLNDYSGWIKSDVYVKVSE